MTSLDTLWMGVPLVTRVGEGGMLGRHGELLTAQVGHPEWVAPDREAYIALACRLAADPALPADALVRVILFTDGCANAGPATSAEAMASVAAFFTTGEAFAGNPPSSASAS